MSGNSNEQSGSDNDNSPATERFAWKREEERNDEASVNERRLKQRIKELKGFIQNTEAATPSKIRRDGVYSPLLRVPEIPSIGQSAC